MTDYLSKFTENTRKFIIKYKDENITDFIIRKSPIEKGIEVFLDALTNKKYSQLKSEIGYDSMYHLRCDFTINGRVYLFEKTANVQIGRQPITTDQDQVLKVPNSNTPLKLIDFVNNGIKQMGENKFFSYNPFSNNCQNFILSMMQASSLSNNEIKDFIYQDVQLMVEKIPKFAQRIASGLVKIGSAADKVAQKLGFKGFLDGGVIVNTKFKNKIKRLGRLN